MGFNIMSLFVEQSASDNKESNTASVPVQTVSTAINSVTTNVPQNFNV